MAQLDDYNTPARQRHLAVRGHRYRFSWLRMRQECICGQRVCCLAKEAEVAAAARNPDGVEPW